MMRTFDPWIGDLYESKGLGGRRILVLGESHYSKEAPYSGFTQNVVQQRGVEERHKYFAGVLRAIIGHRSAGARGEIWRHLAFANFVQEFLPGPRRSPTSAMWKGGVASFVQTVDELRPDVVLATRLGLGRRLRKVALPEGVIVHTMMHPSAAGFDWRVWHPGVHRALWGTDPEPEETAG